MGEAPIARTDVQHRKLATFKADRSIKEEELAHRVQQIAADKTPFDFDDCRTETPVFCQPIEQTQSIAGAQIIHVDDVIDLAISVALLPDIRRIGAESIERHVVLEEIFPPYGMLESVLGVIAAKLLQPRPPLCNLLGDLAVFGDLR